MKDWVRNSVEDTIKKFSLKRDRIFEVPKQRYSEILKKIEHTFVYHDGTIHWANMGNYKQELSYLAVDCRNNILWFEALDKIVPNPNDTVYVLLEEPGRQRTKYWVYEMYLEELKLVLHESIIHDYYIVSKKYKWLISENHHMVVSFVGEGLKTQFIPIPKRRDSKGS